MAKPSEKTVKKLFALSGNLCAFPGCGCKIVDSSSSESIIGEICHIKADSPQGPRYDLKQSERARQSYDNLILLCRNHHKIVDDDTKTYTVELLAAMKETHVKSFGRDENSTDAVFAKILLNDWSKHNVSVTNTHNTGNIAINSPGVVQAHEVHIRTTSNKRPSIQAPPGSIGANLDCSAYIQYLINRYNKFAAADKDRATKFSYGALSSNIATQFGSQWKLISEDRFDALCTYLHSRISKTRIAKNNMSKGGRAYSTFSEFLQKAEPL